MSSAGQIERARAYESIRGNTIVDHGAGGNCFGLCFIYAWDGSTDDMDVRMETAKHLEKHGSHFSQFFIDFEDFIAFVKNVRMDGFYFDAISIKAVMEAYDVRCVVHEIHGNDYRTVGNNDYASNASAMALPVIHFLRIECNAYQHYMLIENKHFEFIVKAHGDVHYRFYQILTGIRVDENEHSSSNASSAKSLSVQNNENVSSMHTSPLYSSIANVSNETQENAMKKKNKTATTAKYCITRCRKMISAFPRFVHIHRLYVFCIIHTKYSLF